MTLLIIAYLGGALTILSPCILPILPSSSPAPDSLSRARCPCWRAWRSPSRFVATLAASAAAGPIHANEYGRLAALCCLRFSAQPAVPACASLLTQPVVEFGNRL
jgi:hypothetical protein